MIQDKTNTSDSAILYSYHNIFVISTHVDDGLAKYETIMFTFSVCFIYL